MCCGVMVAAMFAGAAATKLAASAVVMCSMTTFSCGTWSSSGFCTRWAAMRAGEHATDEAVEMRHQVRHSSSMANASVHTGNPIKRR
jgi:hypothetical protein